MKIQEIKNNEEIRESYKIISQIYQDLDCDTYVNNVTKAISDGYRMAGVIKDDKLIAIIGIREINDIKLGKIIKIEDFVICKLNRGIGAGKIMLKWVDWKALEINTNILSCKLSFERVESQKIFLREGFSINGLNFIKKITINA
jgi:hypothetical protein